MIRTIKPFPMGQVVATPGALEALEKAGESSGTFLARHAKGAAATFECTCCHEDIEIRNLDVQALTEWMTGDKLVQDAFPNMPAPERELFISGTCPECYARMLSKYGWRRKGDQDMKSKALLA